MGRNLAVIIIGFALAMAMMVPAEASSHRYHHYTHRHHFHWRWSHHLHFHWSRHWRSAPPPPRLFKFDRPRPVPLNWQGAESGRYYRSSVRGGLTRAHLANGQVITIAAAYAPRFIGFFNALLAREGRLPSITCYAPRGHMPGSLHHWGGACDVGQRARNLAWRPMYHVGALARQYGLTDGCAWRNPDCGHVDVSGIGGGSRHFVRHWRYRGRWS